MKVIIILWIFFLSGLSVATEYSFVDYKNKKASNAPNRDKYHMVKLSSITVDLPKFSSCKRITNATKFDFFIPTKTKEEWDSFLNKLPNGVTKGSCCTLKSTFKCYTNDLWWVDSCGNPHEIKEDCDYICINGQSACTPCLKCQLGKSTCAKYGTTYPNPKTAWQCKLNGGTSEKGVSCTNYYYLYVCGAGDICEKGNCIPCLGNTAADPSGANLCVDCSVAQDCGKKVGNSCVAGPRGPNIHHGTGAGPFGNMPWVQKGPCL